MLFTIEYEYSDSPKYFRASGDALGTTREDAVEKFLLRNPNPNRTIILSVEEVV